MKIKSRNVKTHERKPVRQVEKSPKHVVRKKAPAIKGQDVDLNPRSMASMLAERIAGIF
jgi:hypothetical protein